jgi:hypothetical protein
MIGTFGQFFWWSGCVCWITTTTMIASIDSTSCW